MIYFDPKCGSVAGIRVATGMAQNHREGGSVERTQQSDSERDAAEEEEELNFRDKEERKKIE
jgi:hypothetical protein